MSDGRGLTSGDRCPTCGGRLLIRYVRDEKEGPDYQWRCLGSCGQWSTDDLTLSRGPAKP
jgi:hypothetical protein